jgi:hypothetical protein
MLCGGGEVGVRVETKVPRVLNRAEYQFAGQLDGRLDRIAAVAGKYWRINRRKPGSSMVSGPRAFLTPRQ